MRMENAIVDRDAIAQMIPHAGNMCLLDAVLRWDPSSIRCVSARHRLADNPLRQGGRLGALCGIEFAAQAMAVHGRLAGAIGARPRAGILASLREVVSCCDRIDDFDGNLIIDATLLMGDSERVMYAFAITCGAQALISGRATVLLQAEVPL
jgi:predicted hotdog family 3-hydroxylacyl-ACP dehydratase